MVEVSPLNSPLNSPASEDVSNAERAIDRQFVGTWESPTGILGWLAEVNNRPLGVRFMVTAFVFFLIGGVLALLMRIQLAVSENTFLGPELYNQLFTMHGSTMMYLFSVPFLEGLALYVLPLMIGSRDVAYPRLTAFGYWTYLFGGIVFYFSFLIGTIPDAGWFAYTPLSGIKYSGLAIDFWALGLSLVEISGIVAGIEIVVTILKLRAPGMTLARMPLFAWAMLAAGLMSLFAFTTLLIATLMLELDRTAGTQFFNPEAGGTSLLWQHLFWFFGHPEVYIIFLPATGIVSMVVTTFSRRLLGYKFIAVAILVTGFVSFGLWVHHMYTTGLPELSLNFFAAASLMIALASGAQVFAWIATLWGQRPALHTPLMFVLGFIFIFVLGGMSGVMIAIVPFDWQVHDTYFIVAHFHYVLIGGAIFPFMAGLYYWLPKFTGRLLNPRLGHASFWLAFIGFNATFFPMHIMGFFGLPRRVYTYPEVLGIDSYNIVATLGAFIFAVAYIVFIVDIVMSLWYGGEAGDNPWEADSLEWSVSSPPPTYGFLAPPVVRSRHPLWHSQLTDLEHAANICEALRGRPRGWRATLNTDAISGAPQSIQYLPGPSYDPLLATIGILIIFLAVLSKIYLIAFAGLALLLIGSVRWLAPNRKVLDMLRSSELTVQTGLPIIVTGSRSAVWCGMICLMAILGTALGAITYAYFYIRLYSVEWPQAGIAPPQALWFVIAYGLLAMSGGALRLANECFRRGWANGIQLSMTAVWMLGIGYLATSGYALADYGIDARATAYGSACYLLSGFPWILALIGLALVGQGQVRVWSEFADREGAMALNMQILSMFWYFVVASGVVVFATLVLSV